jgi:hypothetical protein
VRRGEDEACNREEEGHAVLGRRGGFDGRVHLYICRLWLIDFCAFVCRGFPSISCDSQRENKPYFSPFYCIYRRQSVQNRVSNILIYTYIDGNMVR